MCMQQYTVDIHRQLCGTYDRSMRCWPLLPGTGKAKVELLLDTSK